MKSLPIKTFFHFKKKKFLKKTITKIAVKAVISKKKNQSLLEERFRLTPLK